MWLLDKKLLWLILDDLGEGFVIKQSTIRGQESNGMICSMAELGLDQRLLSPEDKDGIHVLDENAPVGADPLEYLGLKEPIYTRTTNYGHFGKENLPWEKIIKI